MDTNCATLQIRFTEDTISIYLQLLRDYPEVGVAIQAYLRRSGADLLHILESGGNVRLVKGAYHEPEEHAFASKEEVDRNYSHLLKMLAENCSNNNGKGNLVAVATHDSRLVDEVIGLFFKDKKKRFEFQLLMGIRDELQSLSPGGWPSPNTSPMAASGSPTRQGG